MLLGLHVFEQSDDFVFLEGLQEASRHHGKVGDGSGFDVTFGDCDFLANHVEDDFLFIFLTDVSGKGATVLSSDGDHFVGIGDVVAGVENIEKEVIQIGAV